MRKLDSAVWQLFTNSRYTYVQHQCQQSNGDWRNVSHDGSVLTDTHYSSSRAVQHTTVSFSRYRHSQLHIPRPPPLPQWATYSSCQSLDALHYPTRQLVTTTIWQYHHRTGKAWMIHDISKKSGGEGLPMHNKSCAVCSSVQSMLWMVLIPDRSLRPHLLIVLRVTDYKSTVLIDESVLATDGRTNRQTSASVKVRSTG